MTSIPKNKKVQTAGIGSRLRELREKTKLPLRTFAKDYHFTYSLWSDYENDTRKPNASTIKKICDTFGVTADWIIFGVPAHSSQSPAARQSAGGGNVVEQGVPKGIFGDLEKAINERERGISRNPSSAVPARGTKKRQQ